MKLLFVVENVCFKEFKLIYSFLFKTLLYAQKYKINLFSLKFIVVLFYLGRSLCKQQNRLIVTRFLEVY